MSQAHHQHDDPLTTDHPERSPSHEHTHRVEQFNTWLAAGDISRAQQMLDELANDLPLNELEQLEQLFDATRHDVITRLRSSFRQAVLAKDVSAALRVGEDILRQLPESRMADDVRRFQQAWQQHASNHLPQDATVDDDAAVFRAASH